MCQDCVTNGLMSQEQYDHAMQAGDRSVMPMVSLPIKEFVTQMAEMVAEDITTGGDLIKAIVFIGEMVAAYREAHPDITEEMIVTARADWEAEHRAKAARVEAATLN